LDEKNVVRHAIIHGKLNVLLWARDNGCVINDRKLCDFSAENGHVDVLKWGIENKFYLEENSVIIAAEKGHFPILELLYNLHHYAFPGSLDFMNLAAKVGSIPYLKWAREKKYPWTTRTCAIASREGHVTVLEWLRSNGCPYNRDECILASSRHDIWRWLMTRKDRAFPAENQGSKISSTI